MLLDGKYLWRDVSKRLTHRRPAGDGADVAAWRIRTPIRSPRCDLAFATSTPQSSPNENKSYIPSFLSVSLSPLAIYELYALRWGDACRRVRVRIGGAPHCEGTVVGVPCRFACDSTSACCGEGARASHLFLPLSLFLSLYIYTLAPPYPMIDLYTQILKRHFL